MVKRRHGHPTAQVADLIVARATWSNDPSRCGRQGGLILASLSP